MKSLAFLAAALLAATALPHAALAGAYAIEHVTLIDGTGRAPQPDMTVMVDGDHITSVASSLVPSPVKGRRIDGRGKYLIPGLMDVHIHLQGGVDDQPDLAKARAGGVQALASFLYAGVTTVCDAGNRAAVILPLRADERAGRIMAPHIFATG